MNRTVLAFISTCLSLIAMTTLAQAPQDELQARLERTKEILATQCERYRTLALSASSALEVQQAHDGQGIMCSCAPMELDKQMESASTSPTHADGDPVLRAVEGAVASCGARQLRANTRRTCMADVRLDLQADARAAYCSCLHEGMQALSDARIMEDSKKEYLHYEETVQALKGNRPRPPAPRTARIELEASCRATGTSAR